MWSNVPVMLITEYRLPTVLDGSDATVSGNY